jgi:type II secretory pathway pseudopilin PulG
MPYSAAFRQAPSRRRAATLIEILVVLAIIAILSTLSFYAFTSASKFAGRVETQAQVAAAKFKQRPEKSKLPIATAPKQENGPTPKQPGDGGRVATHKEPTKSGTVLIPPYRTMPLAPRTPYGHANGPSPNRLLDTEAFSFFRKNKHSAMASASASNDLVLSTYLQSMAARSAAKNPDADLFLDGSFVTAPKGNDLVWRAYPTTSAFLLHSNPGANCVIYMDFDGHVTVAGNQWNALVNGGNPITALAWSMDANRAAFSAVELNKIIDMWRMVAEDFMPFDVDVTTEDPGPAALTFTGAGDTKWGMRAVIGPVPVVSNPAPWSGAGGIAFLNSYMKPAFPDVVVWVWNGDSSANPESSLPCTVSHEVGHTLGLDHDADPPLGYYSGHGAGATSWGPLMGAPFGQNVTQWSKNTYPNADNPQDDLAIIASAANGFGYRPDDHGNTPSSATALNGVLQAKLTTTYGIIEKDTDVDYFSFNANPGAIKIQIDPLFIGPNVDIQANLFDSSNNLLLSSNPVATLDATLATKLAKAGTYYVRISGAALLPVLPAGYPTYGSIGSYRITGDVVPMPPGASTFKAINPLRWSYHRATQTYDGTITVGNVTKNALTGTFTIVLTLPDPSLIVVNPVGVQVGQTYTVTRTTTLSANRPMQFPISLSNPKGLPLLTGQSTYVTSITAN